MKPGSWVRDKTFIVTIVTRLLAERAMVFGGRHVSVFDVMNHDGMNPPKNLTNKVLFSAMVDISFSYVRTALSPPSLVYTINREAFRLQKGGLEVKQVTHTCQLPGIRTHEVIPPLSTPHCLIKHRDIFFFNSKYTLMPLALNPLFPSLTAWNRGFYFAEADGNYGCWLGGG